MPYVCGGTLQGIGILQDNGSPFQGQLGAYALGAFTDAQIEAALRSFPNTAVRIEGGEMIRDLVHSGQPIIGTVADVASARAAFDKLETQGSKFPAGTSTGTGDPKTREQLAVIASWMAEAERARKPGEETSGDYGNVDAKYANYAIAPNGQVFPDGESVITIPPTRTDIPGVLAARRYVLMMNTDGIPVSFIGAVNPVNAKAIMATYNPATGRPTDTAAANAARAAADQAARDDAAAAQAVEAAKAAANIPPVNASGTTDKINEATGAAANIPPVSGGATGGGSRPWDSGSIDTAIPTNGTQPVSIAPEQSKMLLYGAGALAVLLFMRKGN